MKTDKNELTKVLELVSSRICHDIISPVGAINNGVEFMQEMGEDAGEEALDLIAHSATQAENKLKAFRLAYGAGGNNPNIKPADVQKTIADFISGEGKIAQMWDPYADLGFGDEHPPSYCKVLMGVFMMAIECLPRGGEISAKAGEKDRQTLVIARGEGAKIRENVKEALARTIDTKDLDPRLVHPYAISVIADNYGFSLNIEKESENEITFSITGETKEAKTETESETEKSESDGAAGEN